MDIMTILRERTLEKEAPLAARMRPDTLDEFVGQTHILGKDKLLYRAIAADQLGSIILYGPPGTGKTTLAKVIANTTKSTFVQINATIAGKKDIQEVVQQAKELLGTSMKRTILFIDEIHRFNKAQQDALLPHVEDGTVILIGATTENPYFEVNRALVSRSRIFQLNPLEKKEIGLLIKRALEKDHLLKNKNPKIDDIALEFLSDMANGDARSALNAIELGVLTTQPNDCGQVVIDLEVAKECIQKRAVNYDKTGDSHYDVISAFIKSMRGSDPDAAIYYLARMIYAGEDPKFIARRIVICASEDVGNADPRALQVAVDAARAIEFIGMPEGRIILAQAVAYIACAPKSNAAYLAIDEALRDVKDIGIKEIPSYLKDAHYKGAESLGNGIGYRYPHDFDNHYVKQYYLPKELKDKKYYNLTNQGYEMKLKNWLESIKKEEN